MRKLLMATFCAALMTLGFSTTAGAQNDPGTIVDIAAADPNLSTLVTAVTEADLVDTLSGEGPFTVFAPTNAAFDALPAGTLDTLLADPSGDLTKILKLHVISGAVDSKAAIAAAGGTVDTLGGPVSIELDGDKLVVGGATVITADIKASNGIIHVIGAVITAPATDAPTSVPSGNSGLAAQGGPNALLIAALVALALSGVGVSSFALVRSGRNR